MRLAFKKLLEKHNFTFGADARQVGKTLKINMTTDEWVSISNHPRYEGLRAQVPFRAWAKEELARGREAAHSNEVEAVLFKRTSGHHLLCKCTGHSRAHYWEAYPKSAPGGVSVTIHYTASLEDATTPYRPPAGFRSYLDVSILDPIDAYSVVGVRPTSKRLEKGDLRAALNLVFRGLSWKHQPPDSLPINRGKAIIALGADTIMLLDSIRPLTPPFYSGITAAALATLHCHGDKAITFWQFVAQPKRKVTASEPAHTALDKQVTKVIHSAMICRLSQKIARDHRRQELQYNQALESFYEWWNVCHSKQVISRGKLGWAMIERMRKNSGEFKNDPELFIDCPEAVRSSAELDWKVVAKEDAELVSELRHRA